MATIVVVDDHRAECEYLTALLQHAGHEVIGNDDGLTALAALHESVPDLVVTDILMPVMDGFELVRRMRAAQATHKVPVVFRTCAYDEASVRALIDRCAPAALVPKGSKPAVLLQTVDRLLHGAEPVVSLGAAFWERHLELVTNTLYKKVADLERANAELHAKNEALQQFAYSAAHDQQEQARNDVPALELLK